MDEKKLVELIHLAVKEELSEVKEVALALRDGQEELKAQMEGLTLDVHKLHGEITRLEEKVDANHESIMSELADLKSDVEFTYQKASRTELELHRLRRN